MNWINTTLAVLHQKTHHLSRNLSRRLDSAREQIIILTVAAVLILPMTVFNYDFEYTMQYQAGVIKSFLLFFVIVVPAYFMTSCSLRITGLGFLLVLDGLFDLGNVLSTQFYWMMKPFRFEGYINFYYGFLVYEILAIFWVFFDSMLAVGLDYNRYRKFELFCSNRRATFVRFNTNATSFLRHR